MKILVAGLGQLGAPLATQLHAAGHDVIGLRRNNAQHPFPCLYTDITQSPKAPIITEAVDVVIFIMTPSEWSEEGYRKVYVDGVNHLKEQFAAYPCSPKWFFVSSTSVYGQNQGEWVDENAETKPRSFNGRVLLDAEAQIQEMNGTVIRFSGIYGPKRTRLLQNIEAGKPVQKSPDYYTNRIHEVDCIGVLKFLVEQHHVGNSLDTLYLASDDDPAPAWQVHCWLAEALGREVKPKLETSGDQNKRIKNQKIKALGYRLTYPSFREGYVETLDFWRELGN